MPILKNAALVTILTSSFLFTPSTQGAQAPTVAVFPLKCKSSVLKKQEQQGLNDYMASKLSEHGVFKVIPNDSIRKLISKEKKRSYSASVDEKSRLEIGRELAAHFSVNSKITKIGNQCLLMSELFDLERATTTISATSKKSCKPEDLIKGIDEIVEQFQKKVSLIELENEADAHTKTEHQQETTQAQKTTRIKNPQPIVTSTPEPDVSGQEKKSLRSIGIEFMLGPNFCIKNDKANCENINYSAGLSFTGLFRVIDYLAIEAMFFYGTFDLSSIDPSGDSSASNMGILVGVRGMIPVWKIDIMLDGDIGWLRLDIESGFAYSMTDGLGLAFGAGAQYRILDYLAAGVMFRFHIPIPTTICAGTGDAETCEDTTDDYKQSRDFMFGITVTGNFPI